jgi:cellulose biosynthesis protein BcsQ
MAKETIITFFNKKGGTGKTSLSFNLAKDLDYFLLSNDDSVIEKVYPEKSKIMEELEVVRGANIIYDLGGFIEKETIEVFKASDLIIVPTTLDINSIQRTINTVIELNEYNDNIVIVVNRIQKAKANKYKNSLEALAKLDKEILLIRESEAFINSMYKGETVIEQYKSSPLMRNAYKGIVEDYMKLLKTIQEVKGK